MRSIRSVHHSVFTTYDVVAYNRRRLGFDEADAPRPFGFRVVLADDDVQLARPEVQLVGAVLLPHDRGVDRVPALFGANPRQ